jgi:hypothetical protein
MEKQSPCMLFVSEASSLQISSINCSSLFKVLCCRNSFFQMFSTLEGKHWPGQVGISAN